MKSSTLLSLLLAEGVLSASLPYNVHSKRQFDAGALLTSLGYGGKVPDPPGATARKVIMESPNKLPGVKRVKIRSGPYSVPNMNKKSMTGHLGMLENYPDTKIEKPCEECTILWQRAGLEYPDGSNANIDTGMWLHHMVQFTTGPGRWDAAGYGRICFPHLGIGTSPSKSERYFTSGNERTVFDFNPDGKDMSSGTGYHLTKNDTFGFLNEIMNMNMEDKTVYMTMTYDILDGPLPPKWNEIKTVWLDAAACLDSEVRPPQEAGNFVVQSKPWKPNFEGKIMGGMGHVHDGGLELDVLTKSNSTICTSTAKYAENSEYVYRDAGANMGPDKVAKDHISSMTGCEKNKMVPGMLTTDQSWQINAKYDYSKKDGNLESGKQADIMAIAIMLVQVPPGPVKLPA